MRPEQLQDGVLCQLKIGSWGARTKLKDDQLGDELPSEIIRGIQDLVEDKTLIMDLKHIKQAAKRILTQNSMSFPIDNVFWIPKHKIQEIDEAFQEKEEEYKSTAAELASKIGSLKRQFKNKYPKFYNENRYPTKDQIIGKYYFHWRFFQFQLPDKNGILSASMYKREQEKFLKMTSEMEDMAINLIGNELLKRIERLKEQCDGDKVNAGTVKNLENFMDKWKDLWSDHIDSDKMQAIMKKMRLQMARTSSDQLKGSEDFRDKFSKKMAGIAKEIKAIPDFKLKRKLDV